MRFLPKLSRVAIIFILVIIVFASFGFLKYKDIRMRAQYESKLSDARDLWNEAKALHGLNELRSRELAFRAKSTIDQIRKFEDQRILSLAKDMEEVLPQISGEYKIEPKIVLDLRLVEENFSLAGFATGEKRIFAFDGELGKIVSFNFEGREVRMVGARDVMKGGQLAAIAGRIFLRDGQRIAEVTQAGTKTAALSDGNWGEVRFIHGFGGNLYVGDRDQIWKYVGISDGRFGVSQEWLTEAGKKLYQEEAGRAISFAIDGSLWILGKDGDITKLTQGRPDYFSLRELDKPFSNPKMLHTRDDLDNLYILDSGNKRVVVLNKSGNYKAQYSWDGMNDVDWIAVSEKEKKMLFFVGSKVYSTELR